LNAAADVGNDFCRLMLQASVAFDFAFSLAKAQLP